MSSHRHNPNKKRTKKTTKWRMNQQKPRNEIPKLKRLTERSKGCVNIMISNTRLVKVYIYMCASMVAMAKRYSFGGYHDNRHLQYCLQSGGCPIWAIQQCTMGTAAIGRSSIGGFRCWWTIHPQRNKQARGTQACLLHKQPYPYCQRDFHSTGSSVCIFCVFWRN